MCFSVLEVVIHQMVKGMAPRCELPHIRAIPLERLLDVKGELSRCGTTGGYNVTKGATTGFQCVHALKNPKTMKSTWVEPRSKKSRGLDHPGPIDSRSEGGITPGAPECHQNFQVDLGDVF